MEPFLTTHTGSLPRPSDLAGLLIEREDGKTGGAFDQAVRQAVEDTVRRQVDAGIDVVNDGEMSKIGYSTYVTQRLTGFGAAPTEIQRYRAGVYAEYPDFQAFSSGSPAQAAATSNACIGDVTLKDPDAVQVDIANLKAAAEGAGAREVFMSAASPGVISYFLPNVHYPTRTDYLAALVDAMRPEYKAIVDAGLILQLDCPDLAMTRGAYGSLEEFRQVAEENVEALNEALAGLPADRMRVHLCWGNGEAPHTRDVELADVIDVVLRTAPLGISLEGANPRHGHEWQVFSDVELPDDRYLVPGVIDSVTNFVEHPDLVAQRLGNYASVVGAERVMAGTDCGFGTFAGSSRVAPSVAWAKLGAMAEGARRAKARLT
ncbi:MAG: cobalamin-independent methionine synthase II family protein [Acidimicrobiaceae bacterium]|nr:cobalamin-independent methionine synthase II family protein [Acidimicrobiaceae bacterium]